MIQRVKQRLMADVSAARDAAYESHCKIDPQIIAGDYDRFAGVVVVDPAVSDTGRVQASVPDALMNFMKPQLRARYLSL